MIFALLLFAVVFLVAFFGFLLWILHHRVPDVDSSAPDHCEAMDVLDRDLWTDLSPSERGEIRLLHTGIWGDFCTACTVAFGGGHAALPTYNPVLLDFVRQEEQRLRNDLAEFAARRASL